MAFKLKDAPATFTRPDNKGRVTLGLSRTSGVSKYDVYEDHETGELLLKPYKEIPANEVWLYENREALDLVKRGVEAAKNGKFKTVDFNSKSWIDDIEDEE